MEIATKTPKKQNRQPGIEAKMDPAPEYIKSTYIGSKKLLNKVALITGGDSGIGRKPHDAVGRHLRNVKAAAARSKQVHLAISILFK